MFKKIQKEAKTIHKTWFLVIFGILFLVTGLLIGGLGAGYFGLQKIKELKTEATEQIKGIETRASEGIASGVGEIKSQMEGVRVEATKMRSELNNALTQIKDLEIEKTELQEVYKSQKESLQASLNEAIAQKQALQSENYQLEEAYTSYKNGYDCYNCIWSSCRSDSLLGNDWNIGKNCVSSACSSACR